MAAGDRRARIARTLDRLGIGAERRLQLRKFSKGMLQRVGLAQALLNDPEVLFLDEPMSGLDPLGRRDVRALMLELRDQGRTIFFSSHILSDAEALCSQVAIVAKGRLAAAGRLAEMREFAVQGWELVMANVPESAVARIRGTARHVVAIAGDRYVIELPPDGRPEELLRELTAAGAALVSLNPVRETLEDVFVRRVAEMGQRAQRVSGRESVRRRGRVPRVGARQGVLQPRPLRAAADRSVDCHRPVDGGAGRQDHQGPRPRGDVDLRRLHRHLRRHQPGGEGSRST